MKKLISLLLTAVMIAAVSAALSGPFLSAVSAAIAAPGIVFCAVSAGVVTAIQPASDANMTQMREVSEISFFIILFSFKNPNSGVKSRRFSYYLVWFPSGSG